MEKLSRDTLILIALEMDLSSILELCKTNKRINEKICQNDMFWLNKIKKERPKFLPALEDKLKFKSYKDLYMKLENSGDTVYMLNLGDKNVNVKGDIFAYFKNYRPGMTPDDIIESEYLGNFISDKLNDKSWKVYTNATEYTFDPFVTSKKEEAIKIAKEEISFHLEGEVNSEVIQKYYDELEKYDGVEIDEEDVNFRIGIYEIDVV